MIDELKTYIGPERAAKIEKQRAGALQLGIDKAVAEGARNLLATARIRALQAAGSRPTAADVAALLEPQPQPEPEGGQTDMPASTSGKVRKGKAAPDEAEANLKSDGDLQIAAP